MILMDCGIYCNFATGNQIIAYMLKNVGLYALSLLLSLFAVACDGNDNVENYSFPVLSHTVWEGQLETNVTDFETADVTMEFKTSATGSYGFVHADGTVETGTFSYLVSGQIIIFQKTCEELSGSWTLADTGNGSMVLDKNISADNLAEKTVMTLYRQE